MRCVHAKVYGPRQLHENLLGKRNTDMLTDMIVIKNFLSLYEVKNVEGSKKRAK
jgi:hypothetical protein